ncbi:hypothetical protein HBB16_11460 [Pseudonocardia sp. MCCB 268]|nr:hypothetical protein [Pseudonocardia cytotoxica]
MGGFVTPDSRSCSRSFPWFHGRPTSCSQEFNGCGRGAGGDGDVAYCSPIGTGPGAPWSHGFVDATLVVASGRTRRENLDRSRGDGCGRTGGRVEGIVFVGEMDR